MPDVTTCTLEIRLKPRAKRNSISVKAYLQFDVSVTSPPVDNKANAHLLKFLAGALKVSRSSLRLIKGQHSRNKVVAVEGLDEQAADELLADFAEGKKK
ncbi:MAG: DUF167 domain-containing protein [Chitinispirillaceae bacterium]